MLANKLLSATTKRLLPYDRYRLRITDTDYRNQEYKAALQLLHMVDTNNNERVQFGSTLSAPENPSFPITNVKADDGNSWISPSNYGFPIDIDIQWSSSETLKTLTLATTTGAMLARAPNDFILYGSSDGVVYEEILSVSGLSWGTNEVKNFDV